MRDPPKHLKPTVDPLLLINFSYLVEGRGVRSHLRIHIFKRRLPHQGPCFNAPRKQNGAAAHVENLGCWRSCGKPVCERVQACPSQRGRWSQFVTFQSENSHRTLSTAHAQASMRLPNPAVLDTSSSEEIAQPKPAPPEKAPPAAQKRLSDAVPAVRLVVAVCT